MWCFATVTEFTTVRCHQCGDVVALLTPSGEAFDKTGAVDIYKQCTCGAIVRAKFLRNLLEGPPDAVRV